MIPLPEGLPGPETIKEAATRIKPHIHRTPVLRCDALDRMSGAQLFFKCENFQKAGAFKTRGAVNTVFSLSESELSKGICTHSSGNHAAALSRAASLRGVPAHIVMPDNSSRVKIAAVKEYRGMITFCEPTLEARETTLAKVIAKTGATEVHPYNDLRIIAGQATAAMELIETEDNLDIIMAPVGGGGLLSGTSLACHYFSPGSEVIAAEPEMANDAYKSFNTKSFVPSVNPQTIADGLLTSLGTLTYPIILNYVHSILTVSENDIIQAMRLVWERMKILIETSSAVPLAAVLGNKAYFRGKRVGIIISGGNVDLDSLPWIR
jgi:threonine dehydratase